LKLINPHFFLVTNNNSDYFNYYVDTTLNRHVSNIERIFVFKFSLDYDLSKIKDLSQKYIT
jgi:hypothetical protein